MLVQEAIELRRYTQSSADIMTPGVLPKAMVDNYIDAFVLAATERPQALLGKEQITSSDIERARERFLSNEDTTIGIVDALGRVACAGSATYAWDVAEFGYIFRTPRAPRGSGEVVMAARLEHALAAGQVNHIVADVVDVNRDFIMKLYGGIGWEFWLQNDGYSWIYLGGRERIAEAIRLLRTNGWQSGPSQNRAPSHKSQLSWRYYSDDHYYGF